MINLLPVSVLKVMEPVILYVLAVGLVFFGLFLQKRKRKFLLVSIWALLGKSFWEIHHLLWIPGLGFQFGMLDIITVFCAPLVLNSLEKPLVFYERDTWTGSLWTAYKLCNNPRMLPVNLPGANKGSIKTNRNRLFFMGSRTFKVAVLFGSKAALKVAMEVVFGRLLIVEISPSREPMIRRLISGQLTSRDLLLRIFTTVYWLIETVAQLELGHLLLAIVFVVLLRFDLPEEWPPLFSHPREAYTLRRFWGRFWHRLLSPSVATWGRVFADKTLRSRDQTTAKNLVVAFFVFTVSGLAHTAVNWRLGESALYRDLLYFWITFFAISFEVVVMKLWVRFSSKYSLQLVGAGVGRTEVFRRVLGFVWVFGFFIWLTPKLVYAKTYQSMILKATLNTRL
ncbi:membrane bound O-acyl transferase family-domain-containing protein [Hypoxylon rubiginosum]|uniref:Membrane bound O-acyl transferase family-domain-containing protein n=1 Tax=Hypoxylon rubiginosum TaxID=110542 RepID=A0ACB9YIF5_9PEZI|nr:membrane bound O-acyl transferase family-domain-containing protein [Hypoxylon rubiginosum]